MKTLRMTINDIKKLFGPGAVYNLKVNYNYFSGFIGLNNKVIYCSCGDVRFNPNWRENILFRSARDFKDYTGGHNNFFNLDDPELKSETIINRLEA